MLKSHSKIHIIQQRISSDELQVVWRNNKCLLAQWIWFIFSIWCINTRCWLKSQNNGILMRWNSSSFVSLNWLNMTTDNYYLNHSCCCCCSQSHFPFNVRSRKRRFIETKSYNVVPIAKSSHCCDRRAIFLVGNSIFVPRGWYFRRA